MGDKRQPFTNNFNKYQNTKFDFGIAMLMTLFSKQNQDFINEKINKQLIDVQTIEDSSNAVKGMVYAKETDEMEQARIFYVEQSVEKPTYTGHIMLHEMVHFMGKPDKETIENEINSNADKSELGGTKLFDFNTNSEYGTFFNEAGADLLAEMAMTTSKECRDSNPEIKSADDIIYTNNRYQKTDYDTLSTIARLMAVAMDNNFSNQSYDKMMHSDSGLLDKQVEFVNSKTGKVIDTVPTNDYLYAMTGHGKHLEEQFDKYSHDGNYREMCTFLDEQINDIQDNTYVPDKDKIKEQMLRIADMVNNKMYILESNKCVTEEQKNAFIGRFNLVFNQALQEYDIGPLTPEDIKKTMQSMLQTKASMEREPKEVAEEFEQVEIKKEQEEEIQEREQIEKEPAEIDKKKELEFEEPIKSKEKELTLGQRIAKVLRRSNILMNIPFIEKFVDKQLNVLEPPMEEKVPIENEAKLSFEDWITGGGSLKNLPPIQRISDPEKIEAMKKKMEENVQTTEDDEPTL